MVNRKKSWLKIIPNINIRLEMIDKQTYCIPRDIGNTRIDLQSGNATIIKFLY